MRTRKRSFENLEADAPDIKRMNTHHRKSKTVKDPLALPFDANEEAWNILKLGKRLGLAFSHPDEEIADFFFAIERVGILFQGVVVFALFGHSWLSKFGLVLISSRLNVVAAIPL
ncbi:hypothetical protein GH714_024269 [Hevea brasiliensis]|uniref:Uncharacterized protein n=1 Tax=Hevea brasiliensis TaxID=3981 RepID=A0A6A6LAB2_HEVBR|nr:hypothetical protein GH714_024269 [Hevea brasiliensis]